MGEQPSNLGGWVTMWVVERISKEFSMNLSFRQILLAAAVVIFSPYEILVGLLD